MLVFNFEKYKYFIVILEEAIPRIKMFHHRITTLY